MKRIVYALLAFILISGGLNVTVSHTENSQTVSIGMDNPDRAVDTAGKVLSKIGDTLQSIPVTAAPDPALYSNADPVLYRIRNADCEPASQIGAYYDLNIAKSECPRGYCIFDENGTLIFSKAA